MTREEAKEKLPLIKAFSEGAVIELMDSHGNWIVAGNLLSLEYPTRYYRIKSEPKIRPYKDAEEFVSAQKEHGPYVFCKYSKAYFIPLSISDEKLVFESERRVRIKLSFESLIKQNIRWQDGHPCGVIEE